MRRLAYLVLIPGTSRYGGLYKYNTSLGFLLPPRLKLENPENVTKEQNVGVEQNGGRSSYKMTRWAEEGEGGLGRRRRVLHSGTSSQQYQSQCCVV